jgi:hypothetical protein
MGERRLGGDDKEDATPEVDSIERAAYLPRMWQYALWGLVGAGANVGVVFLEASRRVKGWPWASPNGPGGGVYAASVLINLGIASGTTAAVATAGMIVNGMMAFGVGAAAPAVVKKIAQYVQTVLPVHEGVGGTQGAELEGRGRAQ